MPYGIRKRIYSASHRTSYARRCSGRPEPRDLRLGHRGACGRDPPSGAQDALEERLALRQELRAALMRLPLAHRAVLLLIKRDGLSYEEAAEKLHLSVNTVTSYLFEARAKVKTFLEESSGAKAK